MLACPLSRRSRRPIRRSRSPSPLPPLSPARSPSEEPAPLHTGSLAQAPSSSSAPSAPSEFGKSCWQAAMRALWDAYPWLNGSVLSRPSMREGCSVSPEVSQTMIAVQNAIREVSPLLPPLSPPGPEELEELLRHAAWTGQPRQTTGTPTGRPSQCAWEEWLRPSALRCMSLLVPSRYPIHSLPLLPALTQPVLSLCSCIAKHSKTMFLTQRH